MLSTEELAEIRSDFTDLLPDTCSIAEKIKGASDGLGGHATSYGNAVTYPCLLQDDTDKLEEQRIGGKPTGERFFILVLPYNASVNLTDRVTHNGVTYDVAELSDEGRSNAFVQRVRVRRSI